MNLNELSFYSSETAKMIEKLAIFYKEPQESIRNYLESNIFKTIPSEDIKKLYDATLKFYNETF